MSILKKIELNDSHLWRMVDDTGILRQAKYDVPNFAGGYATDDNARMLMMASMYYEATGKAEYLNLCYKAMSFLQYACKNGWFKNYMTYEKQLRDHESPQDCFGRCIWSLGFVTSRPGLPIGLRTVAHELLLKVAYNTEKLTALRSSAYAALGLTLWKDGKCTEKLAEQLVRIASSYHGNKKPEWFWYEDEMTYCNATLPHALLAGYERIGGERLLEVGLESLVFLLEATTRDGFYWPVGCHTWGTVGEEPSLHNQEPVEACGTLLASLKAFDITGENYYLNKAEMCLEWFLGNNSADMPMIDPVSGGCYDGLQKQGPNLNQSAESLLSWYISALVMEEHSKKQTEKI